VKYIIYRRREKAYAQTDSPGGSTGLVAKSVDIYETVLLRLSQHIRQHLAKSRPTSQPPLPRRRDSTADAEEEEELVTVTTTPAVTSSPVTSSPVTSSLVTSSSSSGTVRRRAEHVAASTEPATTAAHQSADVAGTSDGPGENVNDVDDYDTADSEEDEECVCDYDESTQPRFLPSTQFSLYLSHN